MHTDAPAAGLTAAITRHTAQELRHLSWWRVSHQLNRPLHHASARAGALESIIVEANFEGTVGFAEVRANGSYATGEDAAVIESALASIVPERAVGETTDALLPFSKLAAMAVDVAAWDALGRREGQPMNVLWGGAPTPAVETHAQIGFCDSGTAAALASGFIGDGFHRLKVRVGSSDPLVDVERLRAVRSAVGDEVHVSVDANAGWSLEQATSLLPPLAALGVEWLEQPVSSLSELAVLTAAGAPRIRADESARDLGSIEALASAGAVHGVHLKLEKAGTVARLAASISAARDLGLDVALGQMDQGRLGCAATTHLAVAFDFATAELWGCAEIAHDVSTPLKIHSGAVQVPQAPGLGVQPALPMPPKGQI